MEMTGLIRDRTNQGFAGTADQDFLTRGGTIDQPRELCLVVVYVDKFRHGGSALAGDRGSISLRPR
jgi:hypothetical protein